MAELLQVHPITVYRLVKQGKLHPFKIGRVLRFDSVKLENWLLQTKRAAPGKNHRRKPLESSSAEYLAYSAGHQVSTGEKLVETIAIERPVLVREYLALEKAARRILTCERCNEPEKAVAALVLFSSLRGAANRGRKQILPFCKNCFSMLKRLTRDADAIEFSQPSLEAASKKESARIALQDRFRSHQLSVWRRVWVGLSQATVSPSATLLIPA